MLTAFQSEFELMSNPFYVQLYIGKATLLAITRLALKLHCSLEAWQEKFDVLLQDLPFFSI
jgi:hypothetical protein